jgi:hypothetical protein
MTANLIGSLRSREALCLRKQPRHFLGVALCVQNRSQAKQSSEVVRTQLEGFPQKLLLLPGGLGVRI